MANPFTYQGWMYESQTGYYYTGSNYYDPATGQSFGCRDKGKVDPGEDCGCHHDSCGEDENAACGGVCSRSTTAIDAQTDAESPGRYGGGGGGPPGGTSPGTSTGAAVGAAEAYLTAQEEAEVEASAMHMVGKQGNVTRAYVKLQSHIERMYRGQRGQPEYRGLRASNDLALRIIRSAMQQGSTICHGSEQLLMFNDKGQGIRILLNDHKVVFDSFLSLDQWDGTCK